MAKFTAKIVVNGKDNFRTNCVIKEGILCGVQKIGVGKGIEKGGLFDGEGDTWTEYKSYKDHYFPYTNTQIIKNDLGMTQNEWTKYTKSLPENQLLTDEKVQKAALRMGENPYNRFVYNQDALKEQEQAELAQAIADKKEPVVFYQRYGIRIETRLPVSVFNSIRKYAQYMKYSEEDIDDMFPYGTRASEVNGWVYDGKTIEELTKQGFTCKYQGRIITNYSNMQAVKKEIELAERFYYEKVKEIRAKDDDFTRRFARLETSENYEKCSLDFETDNARQLENIKIGSWKGATIYGGGKWFNIIGDDLYIVHNNGHDGDDWGRNNYETGGAGAYAYKVTGGKYLFDEYKQWIESLGDMSSEIK